MTRRLSAKDYRLAGVPAGWAIVGEDQARAVYLIAPRWYAPLAIIWRAWARASWAFVSDLGKGVRP